VSIDPGYEGWCTDPYAKHDARWMSQGSPTKLVRDGTVESYDDPPNEPYTRDPEPIESSVASNPDDLCRADEAEAGEPYDADKARRAAMDVFDQTAGE
jgi:hypothetical protein